MSNEFDDGEYSERDPRRPISAGDDFMELFQVGGTPEFEPLLEDDDDKNVEPNLSELRAIVGPEIGEGEPDAAVEPAGSNTGDRPARSSRQSSQSRDRGRDRGNQPHRSQQPGFGRQRSDRDAKRGQSRESTAAKASRQGGQNKSDQRGPASESARGNSTERKSPPTTAKRPNPQPAESQELKQTPAPTVEKKAKSNWARIASMLGLGGSTEKQEPPKQVAPIPTGEPAEAPNKRGTPGPGDRSEPSRKDSILDEIFVPSGQSLESPEAASDAPIDEESFQLAASDDDGDSMYVEFDVEELDPDAAESTRFGRDEPGDSTPERRDDPRRRRRGRRGEGRRDDSAPAAQRPSRTDEGPRPKETREPRPSSSKSRSGGDRSTSRPAPNRDRANKPDPIDDGDDFLEPIKDDPNADPATAKKVTPWAEAVGHIIDGNMKSRRPGRQSNNRNRPRGDGRR